MKERILLIIPARGGSKGIPRKNLRILNGKPLIYYSILKVNFSKKYATDVYVTTDDDEISILSAKFGAKTIKRENNISNDNATLDPVIYHAFQKIKQIENGNYSAVITLQPTSPLLSNQTLENAVDYFFENELDTLISGINDSHLSWRFEDGYYLPNYEKRVNRQLLPKVYKETGGFVITRPQFVQEKSRFGKKIEIFPVPKKDGIDIDDFDDWNLCEYYLKRKVILFVVAGNSEIGMGHVYNTLSVANEILNHEIKFLTRKDSELAFMKIKESNYEVHLQSNDSIIEDILKFKPSIVINDILDTDEKYIKALKNNGIKVINFEDLGKGAEYADLVINAMYPENKVVLNHYYGSKYFILRDEFLYTNKITVNEELRNILVSFGGVDPNNYTQRVLELMINKYGQKFNISVVTGLGYKYSEEIQKRFPSVEVKINIKNISDEMAKSDLVITSAGRTTFEVASLGVPCIVLCQNQRETTHFFASEKNGFYNLGLGYEADDDEIIDALYKVVDYNMRLLMSNRMIENNIKKGKERVLSLINETILA